MADTPQDKKPKSTHAEREERVLSFWNEKDIFKKSVEKKNPKGDFTFYDGPPFATGLPHYGHLLAGTIKDVIPRFKTMQGYRVRRRWGWDCHGLPVENIIEKELDLKSKKDILTYGVGKFNEAARATVMRYADEWRRIVPRLGRWVDMDDEYRTMDATYTETVWWIFKQLYDKGLIYEGFKSMNLCPRCETTLSNFEVAQGYKDITDISVIAKFELEKERNTFVLAWTTTPWTLPGNVALAVNAGIQYVKVKVEGMHYILAKERLAVLKDQKYEIVETFAGSTLVGKSYKPLFEYYAKDTNLKNKTNGWKIYGADFVTTEDGTGVVHIAPAFGADDYELLKKHALPFVQHVAVDGTMKKEVTDFAGMQVKPKDTIEEKDAHQKTDIEIIKYLSHKGLLFSKEKLIHSYPHCWRCETPLLNYAASSWFVKVTDLKNKLVAENKKITWVPPEIGSARFGNWLEGARDWAISRSRFWGAPIPVWREESAKGHSYHVIGSVAELKKYSKPKNTYFVMRHGQAECNVLGIINSDPKTAYHITEEGKKQVFKTAESLKATKFDLVFHSPFIRTKETMELLKEKLDWKNAGIHQDARLGEIHAGSWDGKKLQDFIDTVSLKDRFEEAIDGGETYMEVKKRVGDFLYDVESKFEGKNILIITHETPALLLISAAGGLNREQTLEYRKVYEFMAHAEVRPLDFTPLPHNAEYEIDLHRPYIDDIELKTPEGNKLVRVPDVFDCWFESGSMPYGENHYPFEKKERPNFEPHSGLFRKSKGYPADFIAEGLDQTRGWFYSMLVLGVALFGKTPYKKVIVNGLVLAEDGQKMSKSKKNFPDPMNVVEAYGADALRYYMLSSPVVRGQDLRFSEKGVDEVTKKLVNRLLNVVSFYEMYAEKKETGNGEKEGTAKPESKNILDQWIISRLNETVASVTEALEAGELDRATRPFMDFTDDLSTWYLRRSRDRFKGDDEADKKAALESTKCVLLEMAKTLAPVTPFLAEDIYGRLGGPHESVHLESWPQAGKVDAEVQEKMKFTRDLASKALEARMTTKINVRQPLQSLKVKDGNLKATDVEFIQLIKDEVNVKNVIFNAPISSEVELDTMITPELKEEGMVRELIRAIQDLRKAHNKSVNDKVVLTIETDAAGRAFIEKNKTQLQVVTSLSEIRFESVVADAVTIGDIQVKLTL